MGIAGEMARLLHNKNADDYPGSSNKQEVSALISIFAAGQKRGTELTSNALLGINRIPGLGRRRRKSPSSIEIFG